MKRAFNKLIILCMAIAAIILFVYFKLNNDADKSTIDSEKVMIIDAKVENISFYEDYLWIDIEYSGKKCAIYAKDTEFKNEDGLNIEPEDIKAGQYIEAYVSTEVIYEPVTTFDAYAIWTKNN